MKKIKFLNGIVCIFYVFFLLTSCGANSSKDNNEVDLKIKSGNRFMNPLCDNIDINNKISVDKGDMNSDRVIKTLMKSLFDRYKSLNDQSVKIEDYVIKKTDIVLETEKGCVFGVLYSVKGNATRTRWDANEQSDRWTTTQKIYCSYYNQDDKYVLNIIGENPIYYRGDGDKLNTNEIAKKMFETKYLEPRLFDENKSSKLLSYSIDNIEITDSTENNISLKVEYSIQVVKGEHSWSFVDENGKGSSSANIKLISIGSFYEIVGVD